MRHTLFILDYFHPYIGGIETLFDDVTQFCSEKNMKVTILTSRHSPGLKKIEKRGDVTIYRVGKNRITHFFAPLRFVFTNRELIRSVDHIHTSTFTSALPSWIIGRLWKKSVSITIHEIYNSLRYHLKGSWGFMYIWYEYLVCHLPWKKIITVSQASKNFLQKTYPSLKDKNIQVILNQIDTIFWSSRNVDEHTKHDLLNQNKISPSDKVLLFVGRLGYEKGLPYLIEAFAAISKEVPGTKLVIISPRSVKKYPALNELITSTRKQIKDNYLTKNIVWVDPVVADEELRNRMSISHIGVVPSMSEGFCYTAVQMQAMGLSMIASEVGALPEVLDHDTTSFVPYGKVQELTDVLREQLSHIHNDTTSQQESLIIDYTDYYNFFLGK